MTTARFRAYALIAFACVVIAAVMASRDWSGLLMIAALVIVAVVICLACNGIGGEVS